MPSKAQASEGSFALPKNFEAAADTQSEVSDDSGPPAEKATAGLVLSTADKGAGEGGSPDLRFTAIGDVTQLTQVAAPAANP